MKRNWLLYLVIFSLALNFGTIGTVIYLRHQDQSRMLAPGIPPPLVLHDLWSALHLEDSQRRAIHRLLPKHLGRIGKIRATLFLKRQELFDLLKGAAPAMDEVDKKIAEISGLQGKLEEEQVRFLLEFRKLLKPAQNTAFLDLMRARLNRALAGPCGPGPGGPKRLPPPEMGPGPGMGRGPGMGPGPWGPGPRE